MAEHERRKVAERVSDETLETMSLLTGGGGNVDVLRRGLERHGFVEHPDGSWLRPDPPNVQELQEENERLRRELAELKQEISEKVTSIRQVKYRKVHHERNDFVSYPDN